MFSFRVHKTSRRSRARLGTLTTPHGTISTPAFLPVATRGVVKGALDTIDLERAGSQCQITNTFHFVELDAVRAVEAAGGLHAFFQFSKPIFTDSGGFQVFSMGSGAAFCLGKVGSVFPNEKPLARRAPSAVSLSEEGALFTSSYDGSKVLLTPELSSEAQRSLGADFVYLLDICGAVVDSRERTREDLDRTERWFRRFLSVPLPDSQRAFAIIQGGTYRDLRTRAARAVSELPVFGAAIGGSLGRTTREMHRILSWVVPLTDPERPRHLLGIGDLASIPDVIRQGIDLFDCALPTRIARHGVALTERGALDLSKRAYELTRTPLSPSCACYTCTRYTADTIHFLIRAREPLAGRLLTIHNLSLIETMLADARERIAAGVL